MKTLAWIVVSLALLGALLVTSHYSHVRLIAFCLWVFTNSYWVIHNLKKREHPLAVQFGLFLILAIVGIINNA